MTSIQTDRGRSSEIDVVFKALSEPIRRSLLEVLGKKQFFCTVDGDVVDGICVQDLSSILKLPQSTISRHLTILRQAGLVNHQQKGVWHYYFSNQDTIMAVSQWLESVQPMKEASVVIPQLSAQDLSELLREKSIDVLDLRSVSEFLSGFIPGSINLPQAESNFIGNLRKIWPHPRDVVLISGEFTILDDVVSAVKEVGGTVKGYVSYENWAETGYTILTLESVRIEDVLDNQNQFELMDVRSEEEWRQKHIPGSYSLPLANLSVMANDMDADKTYVAFCAGVYRGIAGAARLRAEGFDVLYLPGGVSAWDKHAGTTETGLHS